jgi:hypothetical protein
MYRRSVLRWWAHMLAMLGLLCICCACKSRAGTYALELQRTVESEIPNGFSVSAVESTPEGQILIWSRESSSVLVRTGNHWTRFDIPTSRPIGVGIRGTFPDLQFTVVDSDNRRIVQREANGDTEGYVIPGTGVLLRAIQAGDSWYVSERADGETRILYVRTGQSAEAIFASDSTNSSGLQLHLWRDNHLLVTEIRSPFRSFGIGPTGDTLVQFHPPRLSGDSTYVALPMLPVGERFLQVLSDLNSPMRLFVTYGASGELLRQESIDAVIGLTHSMPHRPIVVGLQELDVLEVVGFRWVWRADTQP